MDPQDQLRPYSGAEDPVRFPCPCCGYLTLEEEPPGTYQICPVCVWDDDNLQFERPNLRGGANDVSLNEARRNFRRHGASERRLRRLARLPRPDEKPFR
jgi:hypothetical protein